MSRQQNNGSGDTVTVSSNGTPSIAVARGHRPSSQISGSKPSSRCQTVVVVPDRRRDGN
ncbi:hypothetical protein DEO72_LG11g910 [Vigna unguiculata]|uniref:Uncharacterized protein n=1 Tax=Vigna unguiculata TaxID=3917 RepID=A0A4D6NLJ5_VIGUN|nr:hypothetical protein DEO72_LG11g910 [Vigna unguiculata]